VSTAVQLRNWLPSALSDGHWNFRLPLLTTAAAPTNVIAVVFLGTLERAERFE
jgi:hypothetical protein